MDGLLAQLLTLSPTLSCTHACTGYFCVDNLSTSAHLVFNEVVGLKEDKGKRAEAPTIAEKGKGKGKGGK